MPFAEGVLGGVRTYLNQLSTGIQVACNIDERSCLARVRFRACPWLRWMCSYVVVSSQDKSNLYWRALVLACHGVLLNWGTHCHYSDIMRICGPTHRVGSEALNGTPVLGRKPSVYSIMLDVDAICVCSSDETVLSTRRHPAHAVSALIRRGSHGRSLLSGPVIGASGKRVFPTTTGRNKESKNGQAFP